MICHSLLGNRATRIPCVVGANSASTTEKSLEMRQINNHINHFEMKLNLTLLETGIICIPASVERQGRRLLIDFR